MAIERAKLGDAVGRSAIRQDADPGAMTFSERNARSYGSRTFRCPLDGEFSAQILTHDAR